MAATNKRGVFSLEKVLERQDNNNWVKIPEVFRFVNQLPATTTTVTPVGSDYAYAAGDNPYDGSTVDRLDFDNDSANTVVKGNLPSPAKFMGTVSSQTHGYFAGGMSNSLGTHSQVYRIDYSNDTAAMTTVGNMTRSQRVFSGVGTKDYGYFNSGYSPSKTTIERIDFSSDSTNLLAKGTTTAARYSSGASGNRSYGYIAGGTQPSYMSTVDRIDYSNDTATAAPKGPLTQTGSHIASSGNGDYGYHMGRYNGSVRSTIDRIDYSNDTPTASPKGPLDSGVWSGGGSGNTSYGYCMGGNTTAGDPSNISRIQRLDFSSDTSTTSYRGNLTQTRNAVSAMSSRESNLETAITTTTTQSLVPATRTETGIGPIGTPYGYFTGGNPGSTYSSTVDRVDYSNDTATASVKGPLAQGVDGTGNAGNSSYGYVAGGNTPSKTYTQRIDYGNDTATAVIKGNFQVSSNNGYNAGTGNSSYGYWSVGSYTNSTTNRLDYASDTTTMTTTGNLTENAYARDAIGNQSYGYWMGGYTDASATSSRVARLDYSNDSAAATPKGDLTYAGYGRASSGNTDYGWTSGGSPTTGNQTGRSSVNRIDYSNDTATASPRGNLTKLYNHTQGGTGSSTHGYAGGGHAPSSGVNSLVDRIDYSNDTAAATPKGPLSAGRKYLRAVSSLDYGLPTTGPSPVTVDKGADGYTTTSFVGGPAYGYVMAGFPPNPNNSSVDRIDFSNDTATASNRAAILIDKRNFSNSEVSSTTHGYLVGGQLASGSPSVTSSVEKIDYANDTASAAAVGKLAFQTRSTAGASNPAYGWSAGGDQDSPSNVSTVQRLDFSNDSATQSPKGPLAVTTKSFQGATGNTSYGWWAGGYDPSQSSRVQRIDYSNDTATASTKGPLNATKYKGAAVGNADYGYFSGGMYRSSTQERVDYANDTATATPKGTLPIKVSENWGTGDQSYGFYTGGNSQEYHGAPTVSSVYRIDFSNDSTQPVAKGPLSTARRHMASTGARKNALGTSTTAFIPRMRWVDSVAETPSTFPNNAYHGGGKDAPGYAAPFISTTQRIDYANDTATAVVKGPLTSAKKYLGAFSSSSHGYFNQGQEGPSSPSGLTSVTDRLDYSNDTTAAVTRGNSPILRYANAGVNNSTYGWVVGGNPSYGKVYRLEFANDNTDMSTRADMSPNGASYFPAVTGNENYGWAAAGVNGGGTSGGETPVDRIDYSNDMTTPAPKGKIRAASSYRYSLSAAGDNNYGYFYGGTPGPRSYVDRLDYSNDTATAVQKGNLPSNSAHMGSASNSTHAYGIGGQTPSVSSTVTRIDYSNDTAAPSPKGPLSAINFAGAAASALSNAQYQFADSVLAPVQPPFPYPVQSFNPATYQGGGYIAAGGSDSTSSSLVDRIDFTNDTATAVAKGTMPNAKYSRTGTSSVTHGYIAGGRPGPLSTTDRIDYAADTSTASPKGPLSYARAGAAAVGTVNYGYWFGGNQPGYTTRVDRLDFASDSSTAVTKGSLTATRGYGAAVGNQSYGYHCGGSDGNPKSNIDRMDYSNDTPTMSPKGQLSYAFSSDMADFSNSNYGWLAGRSPGPARSIIDRVDFSNDTATASARGPLTENRAYVTGTGNANYGYACGGVPSTAPSFGRVSTIERVDYSNDTPTASPKGTLSAVRNKAGGVSAADNGA